MARGRLGELAYQGSASVGVHQGRPHSLTPYEAGEAALMRQQRDLVVQCSVVHCQKWQFAVE